MSVRIGLGIARFPFSSPSAFYRWVDLCDESGIDSLWQTDRLVSTQPFLESLSTMAALAGRTRRLRFGMNAVVATLRDPLVLAKQCATIDFLSDGRLLPVFGIGSDKAPEWKAAGKSPRARGRRANEALEIVRRLWSEQSVDFEGEFYRFEGATITPRPVQQPLPLWIGGSSEAAIQRTAKLGTGWLAGIQTPSQVEPVVKAIRAAAKAAGRKIDNDHYGASFAFRLSDGAGAAAKEDSVPSAIPSDFTVVGDVAAVIRRCAEYHRAGISKFVLIPLANDDDEIMAQTRRLVEEVLPVVHGW
jgi:probable F420-dependent oxidoreductase